MAHDYSLQLETDLAPEQLCEQLKQFEDGWLWISCLPASKIAKLVTLQAFGFEPDLNLMFRIGGDSDETSIFFVQAVNRTLLMENGDASMLFNGDVPVLRRRRGNLELNSNYVWLDDEMTPFLTHEYTVRPMVVL